MDVDGYSILSLVLRVFGGQKQVLISIDWSDQIWRRIGVQDTEPVRAGGRTSCRCPRSRNDIAWKWQSGLRIHDHDGNFVSRGVLACDVRIIGVEQFAEITSPHLQRWYSDRRICIRENITNPFLSPIPKDFGLAGIEVVRNVQGTADVVSELVVVDGSSNMRSRRVGVALPGIRVKNGIADVFVSRSVELLRSALGSDADLSAGRPAILRSVIRGKNLNFLRRVHIRCANARSVGSGANSRSTVISNQALRGARAINIRRPLAEIETEVRKGAAARSGNQVGHENRVASVDLKRIDLLACNKLLDRGGLGLQLHRRGGNLDGFVGGAYG